MKPKTCKTERSELESLTESELVDIVISREEVIDELFEDIEDMKDEYEQDMDSKDETIKELEEQIEELSVFDDLKTLCESYRLSTNQYNQDQILNLLKDQFDLHLIVAPTI